VGLVFVSIQTAVYATTSLGAYQAGFLMCGLLIVPAIVISLRLRDDDVAATRGLPSVSAR
uniref:hypothetical protein n=1 Tax=uncultured Ilumatobacter sp. TaxID=879968 RepID=UPI00374ED5B7